MNTIKMLLLTALIASGPILVVVSAPSAVRAQSENHTNESHDHSDHEEDKDHENHAEHEDNHDDHNGAAHEHEDGHEDEPEDEHGHGDEHGSNEEGKATISAESAQRMGVVVEKAGPATVDQTIPLTGRIVLNQNTKADVRARFSGIVRSVKINLGDPVEKGQVLAVVESNESLQDYEVTAPISGIVLTRNTNIGDVANDNAMFMLADLSNVWAKFHVFPRDAEAVAKGQKVHIHTLEGNKSAEGTIDMLFPTADELTQTLIAIVELPNPDGKWKPGMTVEGDVILSNNQAAVAVKETALQKMEELGDVVFVQDGDKYEPRPVSTGRKGGGYVEITQGLNADESYVSEGSFIVKSDILKSTAEHSH